MTTITKSQQTTKTRKVWTVSNERVQMILDQSAKPNKTAKKTRWEMLKATIAQIGEFFSEFFPNKQRDVLDEIVYMTAATGIAKIGAATLAKNADASERTVSTVVNKLKKIGDYLVARIGQAGKYVFIDSKHANFQTIIEFLFGTNAPLVAASLAVPNAKPVATPKIPQPVEPQAFEAPKELSNYNNGSNGFSSLKDLDSKDITVYNENAMKTEETVVKEIDKEQVRKEALLSKVPSAMEQVELFFDNADDIYEMNGVIFLAKNSVSKNIRIEEHENLFGQTIKNVFEYYKRKVKDNPTYNVFGLMRKAVKELCEKIVNGTAYAAPEEDKAVNGVTQSMIDAATDVFEKQRLINQRNAVKAKKVTGRVETLPDWFATRNERTEEVMTEAEAEELEAHRQRVLAKLGLA